TVDVARLPVAGAAARMCEHALDDTVSAPPMFDDLGEVARQQVHRVLKFRALVVVGLGQKGIDGLSQLVQQLTRETCEVVHEIQRILDLVCDTGSKLAKRGHLFGLDQVRLSGPKFVKRAFCSIAGLANFCLGLLALGDVAIDQHEPATRHRVMPHFEYATVRSYPLDRPSTAGALSETAQFCFWIDCSELPARGEKANVVGVGRSVTEERIRQVQDLHDITIPCNQPPLLVEPHDTVAYVVEGHAKDRLLPPKLGSAVLDEMFQPIRSCGAIG